MHEVRDNHKGLVAEVRLDHAAIALLAFSKLLKAVRFYPSSHPTVKDASREALRHLSPLTGTRGLTLTVSKTGFFWQDEPVGSEFPALRELAFHFFSRLVHRLLLLPELTEHELELFARCAGKEPAELKQAGGLQELLLRHQVTGLFLNEIDLQTIESQRQRVLNQKKYIDGESAFLESNPQDLSPDRAEHLLSPEALLDNLAALQLSPAELLSQLEQESSDKRYRLLCRKLLSALQQSPYEPSMATHCKALLLLALHGAQQDRDSRQRRTALETLNRLSSPELVKALINALCDNQQGKSIRATLVKALKELQDKAAVALVERLAREDNFQARKLFSETLVQLGECAVAPLIERLSDNRWYVTRNALLILGRIGNPKTAIHIRPYLDHRDHRVRQETVRALGRVGGPVALKGLLQLVESRDRELCSAALTALGSMQNATAVPPLLRLLCAFDPLLKNLELKQGSIKALGAIGDPTAIPALVKILRKRRFWGREKHETLRSGAAQALGNIPAQEAINALEFAAKDASPLLAHVAKEALLKLVARMPDEH